MLEYREEKTKKGGIAIVGIGGAGANVLKCFNASSADHVRLYIMSLDERVGNACGNVEFIQLGEGISHGLGSGGDPEVGKQAMEESGQRVMEMLQDIKLVVMVAGLGGGTGSGAAPELARLARESGVFLVSVLVMPFSFEGKRRLEQAEQAREQIARLSDIVFCFENDYMEGLFIDRSGAREVFEEVDRLLAKATASVPMMATSPGLINLGLDELAAALENSDSRCVFGSGSGYGADRAEQAARAAIDSPLSSYHGALRFARRAIVHIAGGDTLSISEIRQAMEVVREALGNDDVQIFFGASVKSSLGEEVRVTLIASIDAQEFKSACEAAPVPLRPEEKEPAVETDGSDEQPGEEEETCDDADTVSAIPELDETPEDEPEVDEAEVEESEEGDEEEDENLYDEEEETRDIPEPHEDSQPTPVAPNPRQLDLFSSPQPSVRRDREEESMPPVVRAHTGVLHDLNENESDGGGALYGGAPPSRYVPAGGNRMPDDAEPDDLDTPPSLRNNDLRGNFQSR